MKSFNINIADVGSRVDGALSPGHMWITLDNGNDYGFASENTTPIGRGRPVNDDTSRYRDVTTYTVTVPDENYNNLVAFLNDPARHGFNMESYNAVTNSCVDFVWNAVAAADIHDQSVIDEGDILPEVIKVNLVGTSTNSAFRTSLVHTTFLMVGLFTGLLGCEQSKEKSSDTHSTPIQEGQKMATQHTNNQNSTVLVVCL